MLGPMFLLEWKYAARRSRHFQFRAYYTVLLLGEFSLYLWAWLTRCVGPWAVHAASPRLTALVAGDYLPLFALQHLALLLFITPALACGSISDEKSRGTFLLLFTTRLTAVEMVVTKWLGQTVQMLVLAMPVLPFIAFLFAMSGVPPVTFVAWMVESVVLTMLLAALDLLASVVARRTATAIAAGYVMLIAALAGLWWAGIGNIIDTLALTAPAWSPPRHTVGADWPWLMLSAAGLTVACLAFSSWRLRPACLAAEAPRRRVRWAWVRRPVVSDAPVRWKERYIGELGVLACARQVPRWWWLALALTGGLVAAIFFPAGPGVFMVHGLGMIVVTGLLVAIRSSGAISRERERQTWEGLLLTPLDPYALVRGKLWGIIDSIKPYLLAYFVGASIWSFANGVLPTVCTAVCWVAAWGFLYFQAANGIYESARAPSSLRALVYALANGGTAILSGAALPVIVAMSLFTTVFMGPAFTMYLGMLLLLLVTMICALMFSRAEVLLQQAEQHIAEQERIVQDRSRWRDAIYRYDRQADLARR
jgi:ABC-type transport system involved in multi-copper enzyme maturation permease subunit